MAMSASWSTQQLAEFVAAAASAETETAAAWATVERTAEALDAEVAAIVSDGGVLAAVGYPDGAVPVAELAAVIPGSGGSLDVPGLGVCTATAVRLAHPPDASLVVGRCGTGLSPHEASLLRGIAHAGSTTMRMLRLLDAERAARAESERQRRRLEQLAREQAALQRVATQVARAAPPEEVFVAVAAEVGRLFGADVAVVFRFGPEKTASVVGAWSAPGMGSPEGAALRVAGVGVTETVLETGRPVRTDRFAGPPRSTCGGLAELGARSGVGAPIRVEGRLWGAVVAAATDPLRLPPGSETSIADFTELVATAIGNAQARLELRRYADEQAGLRRLATLVARGAPSERVFGLVATEVGQLLSADFTAMGRYEPDGTVTIVGQRSGTGDDRELDARGPLGGRNVGTIVFETGQATRIDDFSVTSGVLGEIGRGWGIRSGVGMPIRVEGALWGFMVVASMREERLPADTEVRLAAFTELVATAIANAQARLDLRGFAKEQAALRRVATLVARGAPAEEVFAAVPEEIGRLLGVDYTGLSRYDTDDSATLVGGWNVSVPVGARWDLGGQNIHTEVFETGRPARIQGYAEATGQAAALARHLGGHSAVGVPIRVEGKLWGLVFAASRQQEPLRSDVETRLAGFTELVATAIANAQARVELRGFAEEQAALRRVATLVARAAPSREVFAAVTEEVGHVLGCDYTSMSRYDRDGEVTILGAWNRTGLPPIVPVGGRATLGGRNVATQVFETSRPARLDAYADASGPIAAIAHELGTRSTVGVPISVEGRLWGVMNVLSMSEEPLPADTEARLAGFTELVGAAIANAESQTQLTTSRARIVAAADTERRRIERDLHDGAQQRLVSLALELRAAQTAVPPEAPDLHARMDSLATEVDSAMDELRELARGIHPAILAEGGLPPALRALARRCAVPVDLDVRVDGRLPEQIETAAYYVVSEALTNAAKHASASTVEVSAVTAGTTDGASGVLRIEVRDDGCGGADVAGGSGLVGLSDRVEALRGTITIVSPPGRGTALCVTLPVAAPGVPEQADVTTPPPWR